ncbi:MAG: peptide chain release factor N(5)-glutamine methyltransferase [Nitrosomonadales bacterium]|nr:peptide chain release factor N(5)-glutamine methyltransferase [Nitrosomonadales bacterium]
MVQAQTALAGALGLAPIEASIEARALLGRALGNVSRAWLIAHEPDPVASEQQATFEQLLIRRLAGEPIAYILGEREFFGLTFLVTPATLIPRPDTELLVELALQRIPQPSPSYARRGESLFRVLDLGTGCGAIALSIALERPDAEITAVDVSPKALAVAQENVRRLGTGKVCLLRSDWFSELANERFDLAISNPPYIADSDAHLEQGDLRFEPRAALASGADGLDDIRRIVAQAKTHLKPGGWLLFEHGYDQAAAVRDILREAGFGAVFSARDLAGIERVSGGHS